MHRILESDEIKSAGLVMSSDTKNPVMSYPAKWPLDQLKAGHFKFLEVLMKLHGFDKEAKEFTKRAKLIEDANDKMMDYTELASEYVNFSKE